MTRKVKVMAPISLALNVSKTVLDRWFIQTDYQQEIVYCGFNGHVADDMTWPQNVKDMTPKYLRLNISTTLQDRRSAEIDHL